MSQLAKILGCCLICILSIVVGNAQDARASQILDSAIRALGGEAAIRSLASIHFSAKGTENGSALGQDYSSTKELVNPHEEKLAVFLDGQRLAYEYKTDRGDGTTRWRRFMFTDSRRIVADFVNRAAYASAIRHPSIDRNQDARRIPHTLLLELVSNRSALKHAGSRNLANRQHEILTAQLPGTQTSLSLYFDTQTNLLTKYEFTADFPGLGESTVEYLYSDYRSDPKLVRVPGRHQIRVNGKIWRDVAFERFSADSVDAEALMKLPSELEGFVTPPGTVKEIAKGVYFVYGVGGYQPMFVEFKDFVMAIEAPATHPTLDETPLETIGNINAVSDEFIAKIRETIPGKPIRYVAVTHAHGDHMGGLRAFAAEKPTVLTSSGNRKFFEKFVPQMKIETFDGKRTISDGDRVVELINVGPNPHTGENIVVYLPKERFIFQGDLFYFNGDVSFPPSDRMTVMPFFASWLKTNNLSPARIYGFHSTLFATMEHVDKVLRISGNGK